MRGIYIYNYEFINLESGEFTYKKIKELHILHPHPLQIQIKAKTNLIQMMEKMSLEV